MVNTQTEKQYFCTTCQKTSDVGGKCKKCKEEMYLVSCNLCRYACGFTSLDKLKCCVSGYTDDEKLVEVDGLCPEFHMGDW